MDRVSASVVPLKKSKIGNLNRLPKESIEIHHLHFKKSESLLPTWLLFQLLFLFR